MDTPDSELPAQVTAAIRAGRKIDAIKQLRAGRNIGLKEAKEIVGAYVEAHTVQQGIRRVGNTARSSALRCTGATTAFASAGHDFLDRSYYRHQQSTADTTGGQAANNTIESAGTYKAEQLSADTATDNTRDTIADCAKGKIFQ